MGRGALTEILQVIGRTLAFAELFSCRADEELILALEAETQHLVHS